MVMPAVFAVTQNESHMQDEAVSLVVAFVLISLYLSALAFTLFWGGGLGERRGEVSGSVWSARRAVLVLLVTAVAVGIESEILVRSLEPALAVLHLPRIFVGLFVIAFIGNIAEHASAVTFALRNKMDIAIEIAFNSSTQIAMLVAPVLVFVSLLAPAHMDFIFITTEVVAVTLATLIVAVITADGRSNWLEGAQLLGVYVILGASTYFVTR
jgi:Ca2+:H+ antiporter